MIRSTFLMFFRSLGALAFPASILMTFPMSEIFRRIAGGRPQLGGTGLRQFHADSSFFLFHHFCIRPMSIMATERRLIRNVRG